MIRKDGVKMIYGSTTVGAISRINEFIKENDAHITSMVQISDAYSDITFAVSYYTERQEKQ